MQENRYERYGRKGGSEAEPQGILGITSPFN